MLNNPFFSIIIPTYNRCELVKKCILSTQDQTFKDWECIVINDGSTDNTHIEIADFIKSDTRITLINQSNAERAISRNNGAEIAKGEYYIFIDSDDSFEKEHLQNLYQHIQNEDQIHEMYFTNGKYLKENNIQELIVKNTIPSPIPIDFFLSNSVVPARVCLHHSIFNTYSFDPRTIIVEDTVLWTEILDTHSVKYIPLTSVIYHLHENNSVNIEKNNAYLQRLNGLKILFYKKKVGGKIPNSTKRKHLNRCYYGISDYYSYQNRKLKSSSWILKSIILFPELDLKHKFVSLIFLLKFAQSKP
jgi:glycosyltransferase involved in cell wall biosynthesis